MRTSRKMWLLGLLACMAAGASAQEPTVELPAGHADDGRGIVDMNVVVVSGSQPGPGLWRVRRGENTLYILGRQSPLPKGISWRSEEVREVLAEAGVVLGPPGMRVGAGIGIFRGLTMLPAAMRASRNPDGATLDELLPADVYQRWSVLKARYIGRDRGIERKRPAIAVYELYRAALEANGLREGAVITPVLDEVLKARGMTLTPTTLEVKIDDPRAALAEFRKEGLKPEDVACVRDTLDLIERGLPQVAARANAWAVGDLDVLRATAGQSSQVQACMSSFLQTETARKRGLDDLDAQVRAHWVKAADEALTRHRVSFATLSIDDLLGTSGYLAALRPRVDAVLAPDEPDVVEDEDDATRGVATP
ncbi:TraB/GumN family protein [Luteimonas deserti]|uniref:TraB/GumN family protein n=1 Tax=Luteimonas deserti TaxID=2752306 RepID=A0A7Z0TYT1_9GAMM|nr:TraB/GumN family protein [Luteimonas deserti]NYZ62707.1 TraB/GumN family protein [Luteimonas deserti]